MKVEEGRVDQYITIKWMGLSYKFKNGNEKSAKKEKSDTKPKKETKDTKPKKNKKKSSIGISIWFRVLRTVQRPTFRFIEDVFRTVKFQKISCKLTYGFSDPADTGMVSGFLYALKGLFSKRCTIFDFSIYPQFQDEVFDLHFLTNIRFRISSLLFAVLRFVTNTKVLGAAWFIFKEWWKTKPLTTLRPRRPARLVGVAGTQLRRR
ncbi:MAG: DUF2953 domain-containing protein [Methanosarcinaceae archaeon]|nr:DUF2953 domain-containing protein [Methanosarcinaceae archaeon]